VLDAGKMQIERIETDPGAMPGEVITLIGVQAGDEGITLDALVEEWVPGKILCDPVRLRQVLTNLVGNAIKFTELGSVVLRVATCGGQICFRVEYTGIGMTSEQVSRLLGAFEQSDNSTMRRFGGSGLGLRISQRLAWMMDGDLTVRSTPGSGSMFTCSLPLATPSIRGTPAPADVARTENCGGERLDSLGVMLAEDGPGHQRLIAFHLSRAGAEVSVAQNGIEAAAMLGWNGESFAGPPAFDPIVTDIQMPEMDGYDLARLVRRYGPILPVVALTANAMAGDAQRCLDAGCDACANKPIGRDRLIRVCSATVRERAGASVTRLFP